ncbi:tyrosine-type recombinase/integrase [Gemmatimonas sp.]|jgi:integrase|uniref:tyrosine-type recombinase/integrase n=1 Tax=Gemmatimonas sp. TaxID=1962908 RepID=UPI0037C0D0D7
MSPDRRDLSLKRVVDAIRPKAVRYFVWDTARPGFGLDVWPSGRRSWVYQYRNADGRQRRMTLGNAAVMPPAQAADAYHAAHAAVAVAGADPLAERRARRRSRRVPDGGTVADAGARYVAHLRETSRSDRWPTEVARIIEKNLGPLRSTPLPQLTTDAVQKLATTMRERPVAFNRTRAALSAIVAHATTTGHWPRTTPNPVAAVPDFPEKARDRYLRPDEWPRVAAALAEVATELADAPASDTRLAQLAALVTLALTGARVGAILPRAWRDVDTAERVLRVEPEHKGVAEVPLGLHALAHLETWRAASGAEARSMRAPMFPGQKRKTRTPPPVASLSTLWRGTKEWPGVAKRARLEDFTLHDWRRTFATVAGDVGITDHIIGGLLGHVVPGIRGRYARRTPAALLEAADVVSAEVARRLNLTMPALLPAPMRGDA